MKHFFTFFTLLAFPVFVQAANLPDVIQGPATVIDGDTLIVDGKTIRLFAIDAPEMKTPEGKPARAFLDEAINAQPVICRPRNKDRYGRFVSICDNHRNKDLARLLLKEGYAIVYGKFAAGTPYEAKYFAAERSARLWTWKTWPTGSWLQWLAKWQTLLAGFGALGAGTFIFFANRQMINATRTDRKNLQNLKRVKFLQSVAHQLRPLHVQSETLSMRVEGALETSQTNLLKQAMADFKVPDSFRGDIDSLEFLKGADLHHIHALTNFVNFLDGSIREMVSCRESGPILGLRAVVFQSAAARARSDLDMIRRHLEYLIDQAPHHSETNA